MSQNSCRLLAVQSLAFVSTREECSFKQPGPTPDSSPAETGESIPNTICRILKRRKLDEASFSNSGKFADSRKIPQAEAGSSTGFEPVLIDAESPNLSGKGRLRNSEPGGGSSGTGYASSAFHQRTLDHFLLSRDQGFSEGLGRNR